MRVLDINEAPAANDYVAEGDPCPRCGSDAVQAVGDCAVKCLECGWGAAVTLIDDAYLIVDNDRGQS